MTYKETKTHISLISGGDTIKHEGEIRTVCNSDITRGGFMGDSIFGDSYHAGNKPVLRITNLKS